MQISHLPKKGQSGRLVRYVENYQGNPHGAQLVDILGVELRVLIPLSANVPYRGWAQSISHSRPLVPRFEF